MAGKLVQVATNTVSSPVSSVTLTGIDSDDVYMVAYNNLTTDTDDRGISMRFTYGGVTQTIASSIDTANKKFRTDTTFSNRSQTNVDYVRLDQFLGTGTSETGQGIIYLYNMNSTTEYAFCTFEDVTYNLDLRHLIDRRFYFHKEYEEELFKPIVNIIKENNIDHFLDVGSCWGIYSLRLCKVFKNLNILTFDPIKKNIQRLKKSIFKNKINNIKVFHTALGSKKGNIELGATEDYSPNYKIDENNSVISEYSSIDTLDNL